MSSWWDATKPLVERLRGLHFWAHDCQVSDIASEAADEIERLRAERRWIPVRERLPEEGVEVLVTAVLKGATLFYCAAMWRQLPSGAYAWEDEDCVIHYPTHWMPLPEPPGR